MTTTTLPAPRRISTISYLVADLTTALFGPDHKGADENWFTELRKTEAASRAALPYPDDTPTAIIQPVRRPIAAIAARSHWDTDPLTAGIPADQPRVDAALFDAKRYEALTGVTA